MERVSRYLQIYPLTKFLQCHKEFHRIRSILFDLDNESYSERAGGLGIKYRFKFCLKFLNFAPVNAFVNRGDFQKVFIRSPDFILRVRLASRTDSEHRSSLHVRCSCRCRTMHRLYPKQKGCPSHANPHRFDLRLGCENPLGQP